MSEFSDRIKAALADAPPEPPPVMDRKERITGASMFAGELLTPPEPGVIVFAHDVYAYCNGTRIESADWVNLEAGEVREWRTPDSPAVYHDPPDGWEAEDGVWLRTLRGKVTLRRA